MPLIDLLRKSHNRPAAKQVLGWRSRPNIGREVERTGRTRASQSLFNDEIGQKTQFRSGSSVRNRGLHLADQNAKKLLKRLKTYARLMRLHRPIGIWLLLWPTLWALWAAHQPTPLQRDWPPTSHICIFVLGVFIMRSAGCVVNDILDRHFDGYVARTRTRPLASKALTLLEALILFGVLSLTALILVLYLNITTIKLSVVGLGLSMLYPLMKRFTYWPQLGLGISFAWPVLMVYTSENSYISSIGGWLFIVACLWPLAYDTIYAMMDVHDDQKLGLKSSARRLGDRAPLFVGGLYFIMLSILVGLGLQLQRHGGYYISLAMAAGLMGFQLHLIGLFKSSKLMSQMPIKVRNQRYLRAFTQNQWVGAIIFLGFLLS